MRVGLDNFNKGQQALMGQTGTLIFFFSIFARLLSCPGDFYHPHNNGGKRQSKQGEAGVDTVIA